MKVNEAMNDNEANSCRICLEPNVGNNFVCLFENGSLSSAGKMYEDLFRIEIVLDELHKIYPQYLCHFCDLQLKLFMELKTKAERTNKIFCEMLNSICVIEYIAADEELSRDFVSKAESTGFDCQLPQIKLESECLESVELHAENYDYFDCQLPQVKVELECIESVELHAENCDEIQSKNMTEKKEEQTKSMDYNVVKMEIDVCKEEFLDNFNLEEIDEVENVFTTSENIEESEESDVIVEEEMLSHICKVCGEGFTTRSRLLKHRANVHGKIQKIQCPKCPKILKSQDVFKGHMNVHLGLPAYTCEICPKSFNQKGNYDYHMASHRNEKNVICEICGKSFVTNSDCKIHMRAHTDERRYQCDVCGAGFRAHSHMKNHRYSHFEKEFECSTCLQKFMTPKNLRLHIRNVHLSIWTHECPLCEKKFKRKYHLTTHLKTHSHQEETCLMK